MKKTFIILMAFALIAVSLMGCDGTQVPGASGNNTTSDFQIGDQLEITTGLSAGTLRVTVTDVSLITDGAEVPPKELFLEQYDRYVTADGNLKEGSYFVVMDIQIESADATAELDLTNEDPHLFRADGLLTLVDLTEKQSKNYYYQNINYFSLFGSNDQHPFAFTLKPGDSIEFSVGFFVGTKKDGSQRDLSQLRACTSSGNPKSDFIDLNLDELFSERNAIAAGIVDLIPMVMVDGKLYLDTGLSSNADARCGVMDGEITSAVDGSQRPTENNQSNFGTGYGYQIGATEGTIEIYMNEEWWIFATEEVRNTLHFPTTERAFEFVFAGNTSGGQKMDLTEIYPYWYIEIENTGNGTIQMEIQGEVYRVEAGTTKTFCSDEKWEAGTYTVSFSTTGHQPMQGSAICTRSKAPMKEGQDTPASTYNPKGVSGSNVKELSRISGEFECQDGVSFVDLAPGEEVVSSSAITLEENSSVMLFITWGAQDLFLEFGIRDEDGTEYFQEKQGGSSILLIEDIPAGTYHLYVKNSDAYNGIPAYENPDEFDGLSFDATGAMNYRVQ